MQINVAFNETGSLLDAQFADNSKAVKAEFADYQTVALPGITVVQDAEGATITAQSGDTVTSAAIKHGKDGEDGEPVTHRWDGTKLIVTSASGTSSADLLGKQGDPGKPGYTPVKGKDYFDGEPGKPGYTPVKGVDYFDGKDGYTPIKGKDYFDGKDGYTPVKGKDYFDGKQGDPGYTPKKGIDYFDGEPGYTPKKGVDYFDGEPGKTPVLGTDYFTAADRAEMVAAVKAGLGFETWTFTLEDGTTVTKDVCVNA